MNHKCPHRLTHMVMEGWFEETDQRIYLSVCDDCTTAFATLLLDDDRDNKNSELTAVLSSLRSWPSSPFKPENLTGGFGNEWERCSGSCRLQVVRPGKVQCDCGDPPIKLEGVLKLVRPQEGE